MKLSVKTQEDINPKTVFWTNVGKIVLIYFLKILPLNWAVLDLATFLKFASWTHTIFTQFYNVDEKKLLNLVFGSKNGHP